MASKTETPQAETPTVELEDTREGKVTAKERKHSERFLPLTDEERAHVERHARPAEAPCVCGCGGTTKGRFVPGHDAILKERLKNTPDSDALVKQLGW